MNPFFPLLALHDATTPETDPRIKAAQDRFTEVFRDDFDGIAKEFSREWLSDWMGKPKWSKDKDVLQIEMSECLQRSGMDRLRADMHARFILWAMEARAQGYEAHQCRVVIGDVSDVESVSVVYATKGCSS